MERLGWCRPRDYLIMASGRHDKGRREPRVGASLEAEFFTRVPAEGGQLATRGCLRQASLHLAQWGSSPLGLSNRGGRHALLELVGLLAEDFKLLAALLKIRAAPLVVDLGHIPVDFPCRAAPGAYFTIPS